jgi:hypothetical protein
MATSYYNIKTFARQFFKPESVEKQVGICSFGEKLIQSSQLRTGA